MEEETKEKVIEIKYNIDKEIRLLKANEIDCRVNTINENGLTLLLYKDARVDMAILDETYGVGNWKRTHEVINDNLFCNIEVWNDRIHEWIKKQDVGTESYTEKEKGQASDSFKRAGFNWGIGRELYTAPFIWIQPRYDKEIFKNSKGAFTTYTKFTVKEISYNENKEISKLVIVDEKNEERFVLGKKAPVKSSEKIVPKKAEPKTVSKATEKQIEMITACFTPREIEKALDIVKKEKLKDLTVMEASSLISQRKKEEK